MTDFQEPATYDNVLFIGAGASRQIPNTGFGLAPALEQGELAARFLSEILPKGDLSLSRLRRFDVLWLRRKELKSALNIVWQDFHYAYKTDEYFHDFARCCTSVPSGLVKRRLLDMLGTRDIFLLARILFGNPYLLDARRVTNSWLETLKRDIASMMYCLISAVGGFYRPEGNRMFGNEHPGSNFISRAVGSVAVLLLRRFPEALCRLVTELVFSRVVCRSLSIFTHFWRIGGSGKGFCEDREENGGTSGAESLTWTQSRLTNQENGTVG
jgi:hypothetical protein